VVVQGLEFQAFAGVEVHDGEHAEGRDAFDRAAGAEQSFGDQAFQLPSVMVDGSWMAWPTRRR